jgi:hypothetical protein
MPKFDDIREPNIAIDVLSINIVIYYIIIYIVIPRLINFFQKCNKMNYLAASALTQEECNFRSTAKESLTHNWSALKNIKRSINTGVKGEKALS